MARPETVRKKSNGTVLAVIKIGAGIILKGVLGNFSLFLKIPNLPIHVLRKKYPIYFGFPKVLLISIKL